MIVLVYLEMFQTICRIKKVAKEEGEIKNNKEFPDWLKIFVINYRILKILLNFFELNQVISKIFKLWLKSLNNH